MYSLLPAIAIAAIGYAVGRNQSRKDMALTKATLLQAIALIAAAQATAQTDRAKLADSERQLDQFKKDHDLVNDQEVNDALSKVLQAAQEAPVSAAATSAAEATADFLDENQDGIDDRQQQAQTEPQARPDDNAGNDEPAPSDEQNPENRPEDERAGETQE